MLIFDIENYLSKYTEDCDKVFFPTHPYRSLGISQSLRKALLLKHKIGVTRLNFISRLDHFNIPVFSVSRPNVDRAQFNTSTQGKGINIREALLSSLMESYEHHAANSFCGISSYCEKFLEDYNIPFLSLKEFSAKYTKEDVLDWVQGFKLGDDTPILLPASLVLFPYIPTQEAKFPRVPMYPSTNGLASGNTFIESLLFASFEIIERDALSTFVAGGNFQYVNIDQLKENHTLKELLEKLSINKEYICILILDNDYNLPTAFVSLVSDNPASPPIAITGHACRVTIIDSIKAAILEAVQIHSTIIQSSREDLFLLDNIWTRDKKYLLDRWIEIKENNTKLSKSIKISECLGNKSVFEKLCFVLEKVKDKIKHSIYCVNLTNPTINISVSRIIIPGLRDNSHNRNFVRPSLPHLSDFFYGV
jgi:ribosomal protein S12 methylthiotransferase accessory factor